MDENLVEPRDDSAAPQADAQPAPEEAAPEAPAAPPSLPDKLLRIPAIQGLMAGSPPAVSAPIKEFSKRGEAKIITENKDLLMQAGFGLYRSLSGDTGVLFNMLHIHPEALKQADAAGNLKAVAPSFDEVNHKLGKAGVQHPVFNAKVPSAPPPAPMAQPPQQAAAPMAPATAPAPAGAQKKMIQAKLTNLMPSAPTAGSNPGQGALLRNILKPVV